MLIACAPSVTITQAPAGTTEEGLLRHGFRRNAAEHRVNLWGAEHVVIVTTIVRHGLFKRSIALMARTLTRAQKDAIEEAMQQAAGLKKR